jgi:hypothetical protein
MPNRRSGEIAASKWLLLLEPSTFAALPGRDREPWGLLADFSISFIVGSTPCTPKKVGDLQRMEASFVLPGPSGIPWGGDRLSQMSLPGPEGRHKNCRWRRPPVGECRSSLLLYFHRLLLGRTLLYGLREFSRGKKGQARRSFQNRLLSPIQQKALGKAASPAPLRLEAA